MSIRRVLGLSALVLVACKVDLQPTCAAQGNVDIDRRGDDDRRTPTPDGGADEAEDPPAASMCPGPRHDGTTGCFPGECSAGQYCDDPTSTCKPGCVTDANCGPRDACVRPVGEPVGRCEACRKLEAHEPEPHCVDATRNGVTPCFPGNCEPGQYCVSEGLNHCEPGCVSDDNCNATEHCERAEGSPLGICRSCYF